MKRGKPMARGRPLARGQQGLKRSPMQRGRSKRAAHSKGHLFPRNVDEAYREWIRQQPCHVCHVRSGETAVMRVQGIGAFVRYVHVVCAHVKSRGSSGVDRGNMIPLDATLHDEQGVIGWPAFQRKYGFDRFQVAAAYDAAYVSEAGASGRGTP